MNLPIAISAANGAVSPKITRKYPTDKNEGVGKFLKKYAPDYCWCTSHDLYLMTEQRFEDIEYHSFKVILSGLKKSGSFKYKKDISSYAPKNRRKYGLYLRVKKHKGEIA